MSADSQTPSDVEPKRPMNEMPEELQSRGALPGWVWIIVAVIALAPIVIAFRKSRVGELPVRGNMPAFDLKDSKNGAFSSSTLSGQVVVVNFFFTSCPSVCPLLMGRMAEVQTKVEERNKALGQPLPVKLLSVSVDPDNDTAERLDAYAKRFGAKDPLWTLTVAKAEELDRVVVKGFKQHVQKADPSAGIMQIMHGEWFVLVDKKGVIRGFYRTDDPVIFAELLQDMERLATGAAL